MNFKDYYHFSIELDHLCENASEGLRFLLKNLSNFNMQQTVAITNKNITIEDITKTITFIESNPKFQQIPPRIIGTFLNILDNKLKTLELQQKQLKHETIPTNNHQTEISSELRARIRNIFKRYQAPQGKVSAGHANLAYGLS